MFYLCMCVCVCVCVCVYVCVCVQILNSSRKPLLVAEGQEEDDFWKCLGGKGDYQHFNSNKVNTLYMHTILHVYTYMHLRNTVHIYM